MNAMPGFAPLGRLYDPLIQLTERIHRALAEGTRTVWTDDRGSVFVNDVLLLRSMSPRAVIGTYDRRTPLHLIERDLRLALRQRASQWIVDWDAPVPEEVNARRPRAASKPSRRPRRRRATIEA